MKGWPSIVVVPIDVDACGIDVGNAAVVLTALPDPESVSVVD